MTGTTPSPDDEESGARIYQDPRYCCMDCGCEYFETCSGPRDRCNSCGSHRDTKRGAADV